MAELAEVVEHIEEDFPFSILKDLNHNGIEMNPSQGCKMDCDNCELRLRKKPTIELLSVGRNRNTILFSRRSQLRKLRKLLY